MSVNDKDKMSFKSRIRDCLHKERRIDKYTWKEREREIKTGIEDLELEIGSKSLELELE